MVLAVGDGRGIFGTDWTDFVLGRGKGNYYKDCLLITLMVNSMNDDVVSGYIAGVVSSIVAVVLLLMTFQVGVGDISGQFMAVLMFAFGMLGAGSFWKPKSIGKVASQILKNIAENMEEEKKPRYRRTQYKRKFSRSQSQNRTKNSNQAGRDVINNVKHIHYHGSKKKRK